MVKYDAELFNGKYKKKISFFSNHCIYSGHILDSKTALIWFISSNPYYRSLHFFVTLLQYKFQQQIWKAINLRSEKVGLFFTYGLEVTLLFCFSFYQVSIHLKIFIAYILSYIILYFNLWTYYYCCGSVLRPIYWIIYLYDWFNLKITWSFDLNLTFIEHFVHHIYLTCAYKSSKNKAR